MSQETTHTLIRHGVTHRPQEAKMRKAALVLFIVAFVVFMLGCGSQSSVAPTTPNNPTPAGIPVSLTVTDTPATGVTVLFFQLSITGATLSPGSVSLYPGLLLQNAYPAIPVNVTQLQTDSAFLGSTNVPAGTYTGLSLTFSPNTQLTIFNGSGAAIGSCANNTVCQLTPNPSNLSLTFSTAPFPVTVASNSPLALQLDIHLNTVIQPDLSVNLGATNGVTISQLPPPPSGSTVTALGNLTGTIQTVNGMECETVTCASSDWLTLQTSDGRSFTIDVNSSTTYSYPSSVCPTSNFTCLATGQIVNVALSLQTDGTLLASQVNYVQPAGQTVVVGSIVSLTFPPTYPSGTAVMQLIPQQGPPPPSTASGLPALGQMVTVTVPLTGVTYAIDSGSFTLPNGLSFTQASNLMVGQEVSVVAVPESVATTSGPSSSTSIGGPVAATFTASSITLEPSQITGSVSGFTPINSSALIFTLSTYPNYFVPPSVTAGAPPIPAGINLTVQATSATTFTNLTPDNISGLAVGDVISIEGWLFPYAAVPQYCLAGWGCAPPGVIAAETVVGRPGATPLF
jgi:hypothetical protein